jgi:hypothetical protein
MKGRPEEKKCFAIGEEAGREVHEQATPKSGTFPKLYYSLQIYAV